MVDIAASVVFVTHDLEEAIALADRVFVLTAGPATVKAVYDIDLPRPRVTAEIRYQPHFMEISRSSGTTCATKSHQLRAANRRAGHEHDATSRSRAPQAREPSARASGEIAAAPRPGAAAASGDHALRWAAGRRRSAAGRSPPGSTWIDPFFFAMPSMIADADLDLDRPKARRRARCGCRCCVTLEETILGFLIGAVLGIICGIALGRNRLLADVFSIYIKIANSMPRVVLGSIFIISMGLGMASKVALAVVMVFFVVFGNAFQGVREADRNLIANARSSAPHPARSPAVVIPSALSWIIASLHVSFGFALVGAVVGEFLGSAPGIGLLIATAQGTFNAAGVFAAMIVLAVVALAAEFSSPCWRTG